jgi:hypothetical protein
VRKLNRESNRDIFEQEIGRFKVVEQEVSMGLNAGDLDEEGEYTIKKSLLMTTYDELQSLSPEQSKVTKKKVRRAIMDDREEEKYYERFNQSVGLQERREFDSILSRYINRNMKKYQQILCGVSQGQYRKPIKF